MKKGNSVSWNKALQNLKDGNAKYLSAKNSEGDISQEIRKKTFENGQKPYAVVVSCSDSRVIPESIFFANIGDLFVVRVVGNVVDSTVLASVEYAVSHLKTQLVVVLGHTGCGAINSAINDNASGRIKNTIDKIRSVIGEEKNDYIATYINVEASVSELKEALSNVYPEIKIIGGIYHSDIGNVEFKEI